MQRATFSDACELADHMREADAAEVEAVGGHTPLEAVLISINVSNGNAWAVRHQGHLVGIFGISDVSVVTGLAQPWALTTTYVDKIPKTYMVVSRKVLAMLKARHSLLMTSIDARYVKALRWAKALGFEIHPAQKIGLHGQPFHLVSMKGDR